MAADRPCHSSFTCKHSRLRAKKFQHILHQQARRPNRELSFGRLLGRQLHHDTAGDLSIGRLAGQTIQIEHAVLNRDPGGETPKFEMLVMAARHRCGCLNLAGVCEGFQKISDRRPLAFRDEEIEIQLIGLDLGGNRGGCRPVADRPFQRNVAVEQAKRQPLDLHIVLHELDPQIQILDRSIGSLGVHQTVGQREPSGGPPGFPIETLALHVK